MLELAPEMGQEEEEEEEEEVRMKTFYRLCV